MWWNLHPDESRGNVVLDGLAAENYRALTATEVTVYLLMQRDPAFCCAIALYRVLKVKRFMGG